MLRLCLVCMAVLGSCKKGEINNGTQLQRSIPKEDEHYNDIDHNHADHDHTGHDHNDHEHEDNDHEDNDHDKEHLPDHPGGPDSIIWLAASFSIFLISLCGIFGVLVIPIMQKVFYQHLLQFLIALAIGTLAGDALLHLLPHALLPEEDENQDHGGHQDHVSHVSHSRAVWLGFVATVSIFGFFFFEKAVNILGEMKSRENIKQQKDDQVHEKQEKKMRVVREGHEVSEKAKGERQCMKKYSNYCVTDFDTEQDGGPGGGEDTGGKDAREGSEGGIKINNNAVGVAESDIPGMVREQQDTVIISQHEVAHHGHSHAHSHLHSAPKNISSVAWMVILGDGIHNLADGLAIGASFSSGYMSGVSTSVAVLCHELPHEIGDFAMLLKAGMSIKQAIFYNVLSSVLAFIGMVIGLLLGTIHNVTPWIFTATAGIFLYVALVDMVPELSTGHAHPIAKGRQDEGHILEVVLQMTGMGAGVTIMLIIALYEHDMMEALSGDISSHSQ